MQFPLDRIEEEAVYCKVPTTSVRYRIAENDVGRMASILIIGFGAKCGDLELVIVLEDDYNAKFAPDWNCMLEKLFDLVGQGRSDNVVIARFAAEQIITNAAADPKRRITGLLKASDDLSGSFGHQDPYKRNHEETRINTNECGLNWLNGLNKTTRLLTPEALDVGNAFFNFIHRKGRAELEDFYVMGFDARLKSGEIDISRTRSAVVTAGKLDVVNVKASEIVAQ